MQLTPIKIRGKGRRHDVPIVVPRRKRRKIKPKDLVESRRAKASWPEKVPLEILEHIFWLSGNVNLPRSSLLIGNLLSGESTRRETFITAFKPTWDAWFGRVGYMDNPVVLGDGDPEFQSSLLEFSWTNISFILACWDLYVQRRVKEQLGNTQPFHLRHIRPWGDPDNLQNIMKADDDFLVDPEEASRCFYHDYAAFRQVEELTRENISWFKHERIGPTFTQLHMDTRIPDSLFTSPWNDEALKKFFWLVRAGARLSPDQTWEVTLQAFHDAVPQALPHLGQLNLTVVRLLDTLKAFREWPEHILNEESERIDSLRTLTKDTKKTKPQSALAREAFGYDYIFKRITRERQSLPRGD